jgi:integrase/recombinase XerD
MKKGARKSKRKGIAKERFHISHFTNPSGETAFRVAGYKPNGERVRENFKTQEEAVGRKAELDIEAANIVTTTATRLKATRLTDPQIKQAEYAFSKVDDLNVVLDFFFANYREPVRQIAVKDAIDQFIADRTKQNRRPDTLRNLRGRLGMFGRLYGEKKVAEVTNDDCREFVFRKGTSPRNQINDRLAASNFLNWCVRRQFTTANNMAPVDKPAVDVEEPGVLSLGDCRKLLAAARDYNDGLLLPYVVVSLFAGLRPAEIGRLTWDRVDLKDGTITLDGSMAKTRQRRIVKLPENAIAWLLPIAPKRPGFTPAAFARHFGRVKKAVGFNGKERETEDGKKLRPWVQDYMRHTAISMYLAKHKHEGEAATWAGNSPNVIHRHYKGLVKEADATEFWNLTPATVKSVIVAFPTTRAAADGTDAKAV